METFLSRNVIGLAAALVFFSGCARDPKKWLLTSLQTSDPAAAKQLVAGFYDVEGGNWRWTAQHFFVNLQPPREADQTGAMLEVKLFIPDSQIQKLGPLTLSAKVDQYQLEAETFTTPGSYTYSREVKGAALRSDIIPVSFSFDKSLPPFLADGRELGAVVSEIGLHAK